MRLTLTIATAALALALTAGCKSSDEPGHPAAPSAQEAAEQAAATQPGDMMMAQMRDSCPAMAEGATVEVSDKDNGVALTFTTSGDVGELQARARRMSEMYAMHGEHRGMMWHHTGTKMPGDGHAAGGMKGPGMGHGAGMDMGGGMMPAATATVEDVEGGARMLLVPKDASQLEALRAHARMHRERMHSGECPMLNP